MKIVVPYANDVSEPGIHDAVRVGLAVLGLDAEWVRMAEPNDYALLLRRLWNDGDRFVIVEHDVIVTRGAVEEVWECPEPFCGWDGTLCCAKVDPAACGPCPVAPSTVWTMVDGELHRGLWDRGVKFHDHVFVSGYRVSNLNRQNIPR